VISDFSVQICEVQGKRKRQFFGVLGVRYEVKKSFYVGARVLPPVRPSFFPPVHLSVTCCQRLDRSFLDFDDIHYNSSLQRVVSSTQMDSLTVYLT
jgi:hypothetical protein